MNSISDTFEYKKICSLAYCNENMFNTFKSNPSYNGILEHVSKENGQLYLDNLDFNFPDYINHIDTFKRNDIYGGTTLSNYDKIGDISPTTIRYMKVLSDLKNIFGDLNGKKIIEIGVGYGGQCLILSNFFNLKEYGLVDLDEALLLSKKYLDKLNIVSRPINISSIYNLNEEFDLVISNYAYSELNKELQDLYYDKIIKNSKHGYLTLNFISHLFNIKSYSLDEILLNFKEKNFNILEETPITFENNKILYF